MTTQLHINHRAGAADHWENRLFEAFDALWDDFVDPRDAYADADGAWWLPVGAGLSGSPRNGGALNEETLGGVSSQCRALADANEFAINGHENRISYIVGAGHSYRAAVCKGMETSPGMDGSMDVAMQVQSLLDEFMEENRWHQRQQEIVRRIDRDGEAFLR